MMTKEQEYLSQLEKERRDYLVVLGVLDDKKKLTYFWPAAKTIIRRAIIADLACVSSEILALKKKGVNNE